MLGGAPLTGTEDVNDPGADANSLPAFSDEATDSELARDRGLAPVCLPGPEPVPGPP